MFGGVRLLSKWRTGGSAVHRFDFDGRYVYASATDDGFVGNVVKILDVADPEGVGLIGIIIHAE